MSERIKKLYGNALDKAVPYTWHNLDHVEVEKVMKEFAELIVFECVKAVMDGTKESDHYAQRIENHFDNSVGGTLYFGIDE